jgi:hypothetical protein
MATKRKSDVVGESHSGEKNVNVDIPKTSSPKKLPKKTAVVVKAHLWATYYKYTYTTGPFSLPLDTHSIDWGILNNDSSAQKVRVTVFKCVTGTVKTPEPPGPLEVTIDPGETTHNANAASGGFFYEIQVECNSRRTLPYASAWSGSIADPIPGSVVKSAEFIRKLK